MILGMVFVEFWHESIIKVLSTFESTMLLDKLHVMVEDNYHAKASWKFHLDIRTTRWVRFKLRQGNFWFFNYKRSIIDWEKRISFWQSKNLIGSLLFLKGFLMLTETNTMRKSSLTILRGRKLKSLLYSLEISTTFIKIFFSQFDQSWVLIYSEFSQYKWLITEWLFSHCKV